MTEKPLRLWIYRAHGEQHVAIARTDEQAAELCQIDAPGKEHVHWDVEVIDLDTPLHVLSVRGGK